MKLKLFETNIKLLKMKCVVGFLFLSHIFLMIEAEGPSYDDPDCIVDPSLSATTQDNYIDCTAEEMVAIDKTECCNIDTSKGCCKPGDRWDQFKLIGICLGAVTVGLACFLVYWFWCRKNNPHVAKVKDGVKRGYYRLQEKSSCIRCCRRKVEERQRMDDMKQKAEEVGAFALPKDKRNESLSVDLTDRFWQGQMVTST